MLGAALFVAASLVMAWTGPASAPPNGNVSAPINVGTTDQVKNAGLGLNSLAVFGNAILSGASHYLNFGTTVGSSGYGIRDNNGVMEYKDSTGTWIAFNTIGVTPPQTSFVISSDVQNVNLYVLAGSPSAAGSYTITINSGVTVSSTNSSNPSLSTGVWPAGSTVILVNHGNIYGRGGDGGNGGNAGGAGPTVGGAGGTAMSLGYNITLNNTNGKIFGGGGGGGGLGSFSGLGGVTSGGGGGAGGQGMVASNGGASGSGNFPGGAGTGGNAAGPGTPGTNSVYGGSTVYYAGTGGVWATAGGTSDTGTHGGAAGGAIQLNSKTVTWLGGNNSTQVKGAVY